MRHAFVIENHPSKDVRPPNCPRVYLLTLLTQTRPVKRVRLINAPSTPSYTPATIFFDVGFREDTPASAASSLSALRHGRYAVSEAAHS